MSDDDNAAEHHISPLLQGRNTAIKIGVGLGIAQGFISLVSAASFEAVTSNFGATLNQQFLAFIGLPALFGFISYLGARLGRRQYMLTGSVVGLVIAGYVANKFAGKPLPSLNGNGSNVLRWLSLTAANLSAMIFGNGLLVFVGIIFATTVGGYLAHSLAQSSHGSHGGH